MRKKIKAELKRYCMQNLSIPFFSCILLMMFEKWAYANG